MGLLRASWPGAPKSKQTSRFVRMVHTKKCQVPHGTHMIEYFPAPRTHNPATLPIRESIRTAHNVARGRAKRLQAQVGSGARL